MRRLWLSLVALLLPLWVFMGAAAAVTAIYWMMAKMGEPKFSYMILSGVLIVFLQEVVREGLAILRAKLK